MEFTDLHDDAFQRLPPMSRKVRRRATAIINAHDIGVYRYMDRPDLLRRYLAVLDARESRLIRHYSPHDPNRIPR